MKPKFQIGESVKIKTSEYSSLDLPKEILTVKLILNQPNRILYQLNHRHPWLLFQEHELESVEAEEFHNVLEKLSE